MWLLLFAMLISTQTASARRFEKIKVETPFEFLVGDKTFYDFSAEVIKSKQELLAEIKSGMKSPDAAVA